MSLAPIGVSTYSRVNHLKQTIESLQKNTLAKESELYIFSDAARPGDEKKVKKVRDYIYTIDRFKKVHIIERESNSRVFNNRDGIRQLLDEHGKIIFMEEDIVTAPGYLQFMNDALEFYKNKEGVFSVTGYMPPINIPLEYSADVIAMYRFNGWGFGIWKNRYKELINTNILDIDLTKIDRKKMDAHGSDIYYMLKKVCSGALDALDVRAMYLGYLNDYITIHPKKSLVRNIGHDGSGLHCGVSNKFDHDVLWNKTKDFEFVISPQVDKEIISSNFKFRSLTVKRRVADFARKIGVYPMLKLLKDKIK
ncbi:hypothetical protein [Candidatus Thioglobus sp.]|uniref:hypothetical protein n=1 Tax=Candidatus Thioglobus sp. TaxID=2026721 RepID=UPI003D10DDEE